MNNVIEETIKDLESRGLESKRLDLKTRIKLVDYLIDRVIKRIRKNEEEELFTETPCFLCFAVQHYLAGCNKEEEVYDLLHSLEITPTMNYSSGFSSKPDVDDTVSVVTMWLYLPELLDYYPTYHLKYAQGWFIDNYHRLTALKNIKFKLQNQ